jgi:hypothetical protein
MTRKLNKNEKIVSKIINVSQKILDYEKIEKKMIIDKLTASSADCYGTAHVSDSKLMPQNDSNEDNYEENDDDIQVYLQSLSPGSTYVVRVKVLAVTGWSVWSEASETFRTLSAP